MKYHNIAILLLITFHTVAHGAILDWFRSPLRSTECRLEEFSRFLTKNEVEYAEVFEFLDNFHETQKNTLIKIIEQIKTFPYTTYTQNIDSTMAATIKQKEEIEKYWKKVSCKTKEDEIRFHHCEQLLKQENIRFEQLIAHLNQLKEMIINNFNTQITDELIRIKALYEALPKSQGYYDPYHYYPYYPYDNFPYTPNAQPSWPQQSIPAKPSIPSSPEPVVIEPRRIEPKREEKTESQPEPKRMRFTLKPNTEMAS